MAAFGGICVASAGYLLNACYQPGMDINDFMERINTVTGNLAVNYWNGNSVRAILTGLNRK